jgi:hypothetical protein
LPRFEKVAQIKAGYLITTATGGHYGVNHEREKSSYQADPFPLPKHKTERKSDILNEVRFITGYKRKYVPRITNQPQAP